MILCVERVSASHFLLVHQRMMLHKSHGDHEQLQYSRSIPFEWTPVPLAGLRSAVRP